MYQWRRAWRAGGGGPGLKGPGGSACKLDEAQLAQLRAALEAGPAATAGTRTSGGPWPGSRRWSPACSASAYTLRGMSFLLHRLGFTPQVPAHRAVERDEDAIAEWRAVTWAKVRG